MIVSAATIVLAIGAPLAGRGVLIGVDIIRTFPPWNADTPTDFVYSHGPVNDTVNAGTPARVAIRDGLVHDRRIPLWNPYPNGGTPLGSQPDAGLLAPLNWPELLLGVKFGAAWAALLRYAAAAIGAYYLLRRLGISRFAAICGGLIYCTNGFMLFWTNWPQSDIAALIPALFVTADILRERRRARDLVLFAVVVAAMFLEGYPPLFLASLYALAPFLLVRWWESSTDPDATREMSMSSRVRDAASRLRDAVTPAALVVGGLMIGAAVAAFQVLPFLARLRDLDTSYRVMERHVGNDASQLLPIVFPSALGNPALVGNQALVNPFLGGRAFFLGAAAVVFALFAMVRGRPATISRGIYWYCLIGVVALFLALIRAEHDLWINVNGAATAIVDRLPGMTQVPLSRLVALFLFFMTLLAAFGIEHVVAAMNGSTTRLEKRWPVRVAIIVACSSYFVYSAVRGEQHLFSVLGERAWILRNSIVPALLILAAVVAIFVAMRSRSRLQVISIAAIPVMLAVEALLVTTPLMPRSPNADFYPQTPSIRYLTKHLGNERYASPGVPGASEQMWFAGQRGDMLFPSTNTYYRLRSVTGHAFSPSSWRDLIVATSPEVFNPTTQTVLGDGLGVATSPMLDQLSARFFVDAVEDTPFGHVEPAPPATSTATITRRAGATGPVGPGPLRAVGVTLTGPTYLVGKLVFLDLNIRDAHGTTIAHGTRRLTSQPKTTQLFIPIAGEHLPPSTQPWNTELTLRSDAPDSVKLAATTDGHLALSTIRPAPDGLNLVHADAGAVIYQRRTALPRIRWASHATVITQPNQRITRLTHGINPNTVILNQPGPPATGKPATITIHEDSGDHIHATVHAHGAGYLVIADAIQNGWSAHLDGKPTALHNADHALVAIPIPTGTHTITLNATPRGWHLGIAITITATLLLTLLLTWTLLRRRSRAGRAPDVSGDLAPNRRPGT
ncbi:MAG: YfhO family protein [Acidimicrobiia bacterium]